MIFLSASIPDPQRNEVYFKTADIVAIRDAVRALATVVIPNSYLVWGGHPAITPLIRFVMDSMKVKVQDHITLYQSNFFLKQFPSENKSFENIVVVPEGNDRQQSLLEMRLRMFKENRFKAGIFIGGMEGVEEEYKLFREFHTKALVLPVASTGAAARIIYEQIKSDVDVRLSNDFAYMALFRSLLKDII